MSGSSTNTIRSRKLNAWIKRIASVSRPHVFNPWRQRNAMDLPNDGPELRIKRLKLHLNNADTRILMIGEAPGHLGAKYSGIAFTSERLLLEGAIPRLEKFANTRISTRKLPFSEPSATTIWKTAYELDVAHNIVLWNAFPWHPYKDELSSNRTPTKTELEEGLEFLQALVSIYSGVTLVAIGRKSQGSLEDLGIEHVKIRHPSMGGAPEFRKGMTELVHSLDLKSG